MLDVIDSLVFGMPGVLNGFGAFADFSEIGGEGGVWVSERPDDDAVFPGGVSNEGVESEVVGESSERDEAEAATGSNGGSFDP